MEQIIEYYEVLYYTGKTEMEAMSGDFTAEQFENEKDARDRARKLETTDNVFAIFTSARNCFDEILGDF